MDWPIVQMGAGAIIYPNQREYARTAIQSLSVGAEERSGVLPNSAACRMVNWICLALAEQWEQLSADVLVRLGSLNRYELNPCSNTVTLGAADSSKSQVKRWGRSRLAFHCWLRHTDRSSEKPISLFI